MYHVQCAEIWGGIGSRDQDLCSAGIVASLYSNAHDGTQGGDIYFFSVCESDKLTRVAIADVAGHGTQVSDVSRWLYDILKDRMNDTSCDEVLSELNRAAVQHGIRALTTAAVVGFYTADSNLYFAYAGHGPVFLQRKNSGEWQPLELDEALTRHANVPLGVMPDMCFDQQQLPLASGDRLFLHTDGLTEAMNAAGELFGQERLRRALTKAGDGTLPNLKYSVLDSVSQHIGGTAIQDDVTLLAFEVR